MTDYAPIMYKASIVQQNWQGEATIIWFQVTREVCRIANGNLTFKLCFLNHA